MKILSLVIASLLLTVNFSADAKMGWKKQFEKRYVGAKYKVSCSTCHIGDEEEGEITPYGQDFIDNGKDYEAIEKMDSDADGVNNITEIKNGTHPGDASSKSLNVFEDLSREEIQEIVEIYLNNEL